MIVSTRGLTKAFGSTVALDAVDLAVPEQCVYGLVGPNGAGKTTLLSILAGLRRQTAGVVEMNVGASEWSMCPDTPVFEPWLTAEEVLRLSASLAGVDVPAARVGSLLDEAGLADVTGRRVGGFSRGMTQRLAVAATVVTEPRLVILDEPCSALDPAGRVEVLDLVRRAGEDCTVIFSSHVLADVQRVCDTVGVLDGGRIVFQGQVADLLRRYSRPVWHITVRDDPRRLAAALEGVAWVERVSIVDGDRVRLEATCAGVAEQQIVGVLAAEGAALISFEPEAPDLESVFLQLTGSTAP